MYMTQQFLILFLIEFPLCFLVLLAKVPALERLQQEAKSLKSKNFKISKKREGGAQIKR